MVPESDRPSHGKHGRRSPRLSVPGGRNFFDKTFEKTQRPERFNPPGRRFTFFVPTFWLIEKIFLCYR